MTAIARAFHLTSAVLAVGSISAGERFTMKGLDTGEVKRVGLAPLAKPKPTTSPTGYEPKLLWSPAWQAAAAKHPEMRYVIAQADKAVAGKPAYGDSGQFAAIAFQATGKKAYANAAYRQTVAFIRRAPVPRGNDHRAYGVEMVLVGDWCRPALTEAEWSDYLAAIDFWAKHALGEDQPPRQGGIAKADTDQSSGDYFFLACADLALGTDYLTRSTVAPHQGEPRPIGGLDATAADYTTVRNQLAAFARYFEGGSWMEGTQYNSGTLSNVLLGVTAINRATGTDHFSEYTSQFPAAARATCALVTPDLKTAYEWGDVEQPDAFEADLYEWYFLLDTFPGVLGDTPEGRDAASMSAALRAKYPKREPWWRSFWLLGQGVRPGRMVHRGHDSPGMGLYVEKDADNLFAVMFTARHNFHHMHESWGGFDLYRRGAWAIDHPQGYGGSHAQRQFAVNGLLLYGLGPMFEGASGRLDDGTVWGETGGPYKNVHGTLLIPKPAYDPPPEFLRKHRREIKRDGDRIVVVDQVDMDDPRTLPKFDRYKAAERDRIEAEAANPIQFVIHAPVKPTVETTRVSWAVPGGGAVAVTWDGERSVELVDESTWPEKGTGVRPEQRGWQARISPVGYPGGKIELRHVIDVTD